MSDIFLRELLVYGGTALKALLLVRLWQLGLTRRYPTLVVYLGFALFRSAVAAYLTTTGTRLFGLSGYNLFYVITQPVLWTLYFLIILEFYSLMLKDFSGVRRLGRLVLFAGLGGITLACGALMILDQEPGLFRYPFLAYLARQERGVYFCLSALTLVILLFASHYRLSVPRNIHVLFGCFGGYFVLNTALLVLHDHFGDSFFFPRSVLNGLFFLMALVGAIVFLSRAGEMQDRSLAVRVLWGAGNRELEMALALQLQNFNQTLLRLLRQ